MPPGDNVSSITMYLEKLPSCYSICCLSVNMPFCGTIRSSNGQISVVHTFFAM